MSYLASSLHVSPVVWMIAPLQQRKLNQHWSSSKTNTKAKSHQLSKLSLQAQDLQKHRNLPTLQLRKNWKENAFLIHKSRITARSKMALTSTCAHELWWSQSEIRDKFFWLIYSARTGCSRPGTFPKIQVRTATSVNREQKPLFSCILNENKS